MSNIELKMSGYHIVAIEMDEQASAQWKWKEIRKSVLLLTLPLFDNF